MKYPIQRGIVQDIDSLEKIYDYIFNDEMIVDTTQHNVLITGISTELEKNYSQIKQEGSIKNNDKENINEIKEEKNGTKKYAFDYNKYKLENDGNEEYPAIVIDNGSTFLRFGISGDNVPRGEIPTCIGYPSLEKKKKF